MRGNFPFIWAPTLADPAVIKIASVFCMVREGSLILYDDDRDDNKARSIVVDDITLFWDDLGVRRGAYGSLREDDDDSANYELQVW